MGLEKIYYAAMILAYTASVLFSPLLYIRRIRTVMSVRHRRQWEVIVASSLLMIAMLLFVWWKRP